MLLPCCVQQQQQDWCTIEEIRFSTYEQPEREQALARLMLCMEDTPRFTDSEAEELAEASLLKEGSTCGWIAAEKLEAAEAICLAMPQEQRIRLAADVMAALLTSPTQAMGGESAGCRNREQVHSYDQLDVTRFRLEADEFFALFIRDAREDATRQALFKRMAARLMLEDVACNTALDADFRCAAVECLRHICREGLLEADGAWDMLYMVDALPLKAGEQELENALFGGPAWERTQADAP